VQLFWMVTNPTRQPSFFSDHDGTGRVLHAIRCSATEAAAKASKRRAVCGLLARKGFSGSFFVEDKCRRCVKALAKEAK
jgi:hypothetical protein